MQQEALSQDQESFKMTIENLLQHSQLWPIMVEARQIWSLIGDPQQEPPIVTKYQNFIDDTNQMTCALLMYSVKVFFTGLRIPWKLKQDSLMNFINKKLHTRLEQTRPQYPDFIQSRYDKYGERILSFAKAISEGMFETMEETIIQLVNERFSSKELMRSLRKLMIQQLKRVTYELYDFCHLPTPSTIHLFTALKEGTYQLIMDFHTFIYTMSYFSNVEMDTLNRLMSNNTCLANIDTYKMMQVEISKRIYKHVSQLLEEQSFYRPEFYQFKDHILFQSLKYFFHYSEQVNPSLSYKDHPNSFKDLIPDLGVEVYEPPLVNVQIFSAAIPKILEDVKEHPSEHDELTHFKDHNLLFEDVTKVKFGLNLYTEGRELFVDCSQDIKSRNSNSIGIIVQFTGDFKEYGSFFLGLKNGCVHIKELPLIDPTVWGPISSIETYEMLPFTEFLAMSSVTLRHEGSMTDEERRIKSAPSLDKENTQGVSFRTKKMILEKKELKSVMTINYDEYLSNPEIHHKHIQVPKKPIRYGTSVELAAGKTLGTGLGYLIVNCLDEDMPWDDKLKDAGYTTMQLGAIALVSSRLPVVGIIIQSVILAYAVTVTVNNKVVAGDEKAKSLGHLAVQITIGVVCIVGGHILIPLHFWGAFFGGLTAGICIGLYSKFVVPKTMVSLINMIEKLDRRITPEGCIYYSPIVIEIMCINEKFFMHHKPEKFSKSDWLTLALVCLVNEVHYMYQLLLARHMAKITKKLEKSPNDKDLLRQMEEMKILWIQNDVNTHDWKECRKYILKKKLSVIDHHEKLQEFIEGMIENFKIP